MLASRHLISIVSLASCLLLATGLHAQPQAAKPAQGTKLSNFIPTIHFGVLVSVAMVGGLVGNLVILPLLLALVPGER